MQVMAGSANVKVHKKTGLAQSGGTLRASYCARCNLPTESISRLSQNSSCSRQVLPATFYRATGAQSTSRAGAGSSFARRAGPCPSRRTTSGTISMVCCPTGLPGQIQSGSVQGSGALPLGPRLRVLKRWGSTYNDICTEQLFLDRAKTLNREPGR